MQMVKDHVGDAHEKLVAADDLNWIGFWGLPYSMLPVMQKKKHEQLNTFYYKMNQDYIETRASVYMKNFRVLALITIFVVSAFVYQDIMRKHEYGNYCTNVFKTQAICESTEDAHGLCIWIDGACKRNTNVTANDCSWHFDNNDITSARAERMFLNALLARFAVLVPVSLGMFALTYLRWFKTLSTY